MLKASIGCFPLKTGQKVNVLKYVKFTLIYLHILYMKTNSFADDASELIIFLEVLWVESAHHIYMFDISYNSLDYDPKLKTQKTHNYI